MTTRETRDAILEYLRRELVGPSPGFPAVQLNREEILRPQDPPRLRYSAGVLFPLKAAVASQLETSEEMAEAADANPPEDEERLDEPTELPDSPVDREQQPETDLDLNLTNEYLPSAMGISALVELPEVLRVRISAARYEKQDLPGFVRSKKQNTGSYGWCRVPFTVEIDLPRQDLLGDDTVTKELPVIGPNNGDGLKLYVISRPTTLGTSPSITRLLTVSLINRNYTQTSSSDQLCFFQCEVQIMDIAGGSCFLEYPDRKGQPDAEERSLQFLYRERKVFAVGHGCAATWSTQEGGRCGQVWTEILPIYEIKPIEHVEVPGLALSMETLADSQSNKGIELCERLADAYRSWIDGEEKRIGDPNIVPPLFRDVASQNLALCGRALSRIGKGINLLKNNAQVREAFALANEAMYLQQAHYELASRSIREWVFKDKSLELSRPYRKPDYRQKNAIWRPFQLAFLLMNLDSMSDEENTDRDIVDLIWFPTGGGKTEAYLGLAAFTILLRRLKEPKNAGTTVLMRYTLRLLTAQQFQRAASLICACELIRRKHERNLGKDAISIGLWVGQGVAPNRHEEATRGLNELLKGSRINPFVVLACPWCGAGMGPFKAGNSWRVKGYIKKTNPSRVEFYCEDSDCPFSEAPGLPVHVVDEAIYANPPSLVVGTVDKFAMLPWRPEARSLFGLEHNFSPPELIIQDELHLISGPLGSMVAHYEMAIEALCSTSGSAPKIVASTATIARSAEQIQALYAGRSSFLFPPQGLRVGDSFFARENPEAPGRCYAGVFASALPSHVTAQIRVISTLLQASKSLSPDNVMPVDPYWTLMVYFNSIRELGHAATLIRADIREYMNAMWDRQGLTMAGGGKDATKLRRFINRDLELTSRIQSNQIPEILQQLFAKFQGDKDYSAVDVCLATNMIQVGLDVPRLSLMAVIGQPKTTAEYIQASSRVGRTEPGLVVTIYNAARPRDRSHYEHFRAYHQSIYRFVEPTSITPFAQPVIERALHAVTVALTRTLGDSRIRTRPNSPPPNDDLIERIRTVVVNRLSKVDNEQTAAALQRFDDVISEWRRVPPAKYGDFSPPDEEEPLMYPSGTDRHPRWSTRPLPTPSSLRNVDATCDANVISNYPQPD